MHHSHDHHHTEGSFRTAFLLTVTILVIEATAGILANSLALISDAGHILTDVVALGLAWYAAHLAQLPADRRNTYGYRRGGILVAAINAVTLVLVAIVVTTEAVLRLRHPEHVSGGLVMIASGIALAVNLFIVRSLHGHRRENLNVRAAWFHVVGDTAASAAVLLSGTIILLWGLVALDPVLSIAISLLIAYGAWSILRDTVGILMEATPRGVDVDALISAMQEVPGVVEVHDLHVWALSDGLRLLSAHVQVPDQNLGAAANLLSDLRLLLHRRFQIEHATIELECTDCSQPRRRPIELRNRAGS